MSRFPWGHLCPLAFFLLNLVTPAASFTLGDLQALVVGDLFAQTAINVSGLNPANVNAPLSGPIPAELGQLTNLTILIIRDFPLSGPIPPELGNLTGLSVLHLAASGLTGTLPPELSSLSNLSEIDVSENRLNGSLPTELGALKKMVEFDVSKNNLSGPIPPSFGQMQNMVFLELHENNFTGPIPRELGALKNLRALSLQNNRFDGPIPPELGNLTSLAVLALHNNSFTGPLPRELARCTNLVNLFMWDNNLSGMIPPEFAKLTSLVNIYLNRNLLSGPVPVWLANLTQLQHVDLSGNNLTGTIPPELGGLPQLVQLHLGINRLIGPIPKTLSRLTNLEELYLMSNNLTGPIPTELASLPNLTTLTLFGNGLTGSPPPELAFAPKLTTLQLQNNSLSGPVYSGLVTKFGSANVLAGNPGLIVTDTLAPPETPVPQPPLETQVPPPPLETPVPQPPLETPVPLPPPQKSSSNVAVIAAAVAGGAGLLVAALGGLCLRARLKRRARGRGRLEVSLGEKWAVTPLTQPSSSSGGSGASRPEEPLGGRGLSFTWAELAAATGGFAAACAVGSGSFGTVYRAVLKDGSTVAVKRLDRRPSRRDDEERAWRAEFAAASQVRHRNLVRLLGSVSEGDERLLVLEFFPEGSLWARLHAGAPLSWEHRMVIAEGVCRGLAYLHHDIHPPLVHRDVKASNVLLRPDGGEPCLADFGLARLVDFNRGENSSVVKGTLLYMAPEYLLGGPAFLSVKCDVYSFGILLVELLTGQTVAGYQGNGQGTSLVEHVSRSVAGGRGLEVLDPAVWEAFSVAEADCCLKVAMQSLQKEPSARPTMEQVSFELQIARRRTRGSFGRSAQDDLLSVANSGSQVHSGAMQSGQFRFENPR